MQYPTSIPPPPPFSEAMTLGLAPPPKGSERRWRGMKVTLRILCFLHSLHCVVARNKRERLTWKHL